jgi:hypothetical protein
MRFERFEEEEWQNPTLTVLQANTERLVKLHFRTALVPLLMLRKLCKHHDTLIETDLAGISEAASGVAGRP